MLLHPLSHLARHFGKSSTMHFGVSKPSRQCDRSLEEKTDIAFVSDGDSAMELNGLPRHAQARFRQPRLRPACHSWRKITSGASRRTQYTPVSSPARAVTRNPVAAADPQTKRLTPLTLVLPPESDAATLVNKGSIPLRDSCHARATTSFPSAT